MTKRPKISIYIAASIDGYIARKDNSLDWLDRVGGFDEDYGCKKLLDIAGFLGQELCATAVLVPEGNTTKMQRVAIKSSFQNKGIRSLMMTFCEVYAREKGCGSVYCHARDTAIPFYLKHQYALEGNPFEEDGIPHHKMRKILV